jgi:hypothetical protein
MFEISFVIAVVHTFVIVARTVAVIPSFVVGCSPFAAEQSLNFRILDFVDTLFRIDFAKSCFIRMDFLDSVMVDEFQTQIHHYFNQPLVLDLARNLLVSLVLLLIIVVLMEH